MRGDFRVRGYELSTLLGVNASGEMWLARTQGSGDQVALKRLRLRSVQAREEVARLVSLLDLLDHPHLVRVRELIPHGDEVVLVLDHAEGGSLDQLLSGRGGLDPGEVVTTVAPIAEALAVAHEHGLVHADVTPETILFSADGRPMLADLGVLGLIEGGEALGTHGYADPALHGAGPTPAGDVYALAAVCHTGLTGVPPRPGQSRQPLADAVPGLPTGFVHAVGAGLQAVPARRPDAAQFANLVYAACSPAPVRFPVGLVLSDNDIAAALAGASGAEPTPEPPPATDPFARALGGPGAAESGPAAGAPVSSGPGAVAAGPPLGAPMPVGAAPSPAGAHDEDDDGDGRRIGLMIAGGAALLLVAGAVVGGIAWANRSDPAAPPAASGDGSVPSSDDAASRIAPTPTEFRDPRASDPAPSTSASPRGTPGPPVSASPAPPPSAETRWRRVLDALDGHRARAFAESDPAALAAVYVAGSDLATKDRAEIDKCASAGCHVEGLRFDIKKVDVVAESRSQVVLEVVDQLQAYTLVSDSGGRTARPAGETKLRRITLVRRAGDSWLIARIVAA